MTTSRRSSKTFNALKSPKARKTPVLRLASFDRSVETAGSCSSTRNNPTPPWPQTVSMEERPWTLMLAHRIQAR